MPHFHPLATPEIYIELSEGDSEGMIRQLSTQFTGGSPCERARLTVVSQSFSASEMALVLGFAEKTQILVGNVSRSLELNERLDKNVKILQRLVDL